MESIHDPRSGPTCGQIMTDPGSKESGDVGGLEACPPRLRVSKITDFFLTLQKKGFSWQAI